MKRLSLLLENREKYTETAFEYEMGLAETSVNGIRKIRALLTKAMSKKKQYTAQAVSEKTDDRTETALETGKAASEKASNA